MIATTDNIFGFLTLIAYLATLLPSNLKVLYPNVTVTALMQVLISYRQVIGAGALFLAIVHAYTVVKYHSLDWSSLEFYQQSATGLLLFATFVLLTITSHNWSLKKLRLNWKQLHLLTSLGVVLLLWHIAYEASGLWDLSTLIWLLVLTVIVELFCYR